MHHSSSTLLVVCAFCVINAVHLCMKANVAQTPLRSRPHTHTAELEAHMHWHKYICGRQSCVFVEIYMDGCGAMFWESGGEIGVLALFVNALLC